MFVFGLVALCMVLLAIALVVWPLYANRKNAGPGRESINVALYRDRLAELEEERDSGALSAEQFDLARVELQRDLLENVVPEGPAGEHARSMRTAFVLAALLPLLAGGLYLWLGAPDFIDVERATQHQAGADMGSMDEAVTRLRARLASNPGDVEGWLLLGRSLTVQQKYAAAADIYAEALRNVGEQADVLALYAEALAMVQGQVSGQPEQLALRALELDPDAVIALWLSGFAASERGDFAAAVKHWERLLALIPDDGRMSQMVRDSLAEARTRLGATVPSPAAAADAAVRITVRLADALRAELTAQDVLFVYAQDPAGGRMPIASVRRAAAFPAEVVLDDSTLLQPGRRLADLPALKLVARISRSGEATTRSGDLYGEARWAAGEGKATIVIERTVP